MEWHAELKEYAEKAGLTFLSAPFDEGRARLLNSIGVAAFKIASGDITDEPLLSLVASYGKPVILSTGASYLDEVRKAVDTLIKGGAREIALLHCSALYPPAFEEVNLLSMVTLRDEFK
ncbi:MAG: N-acetylneuraminate synthase family protein, partial [Deltaproteobacteria bacterium]|nr:N-acetylneuraminate synthase family protein [Deltaproteobacteria bacterium]